MKWSFARRDLSAFAGRVDEKRAMPDSPARGRLLVVSNYFPPYFVGGAEIVAAHQAKMMQRAGWDVLVFAADFSPRAGKRSPKVRQDHYDDLTVVRVRPRRKPDYAFYNPSTTRHFVRTLSAFAPDVVHFHNLSGLGVQLIDEARASGAKVVVTLHDRWAFCFKGTLLRNDLSICGDFEQCHRCAPTLGSPEGQLPTRLRRDYVMSRLQRVDVLIAPSRGLADDFVRSGLPRSRLVELTSGVDLAAIEARLRTATSPIDFLFAGYLGEHKGVPHLAEAIRLLWADESLRGRWSVTLAGDGALEPSLREFIRREGLESVFRMLGRIDNADLVRRLPSAEVVVLPSICPENQPVSLLEGIVSGAALIATRVDGAVDLVEHDVNGLVCPRADPAALAAAMRRLIVTPGLVETFSRENLRRRGLYDEQAAGARLDEILRAPRRHEPSDEIELACGVDAAGIVAANVVEPAPVSAGGRRLRLIWWRWERAGGHSRRLWMAAPGRNPLAWVLALARYGARLVFGRALDAEALARLDEKERGRS